MHLQHLQAAVTMETLAVGVGNPEIASQMGGPRGSPPPRMPQGSLKGASKASP